MHQAKLKEAFNMTKIILASLIAISFSAFAHEDGATETTTPPAAEGTMTETAPADGAAKMDKKAKMAHKKAMGKHGKGHGKGKKEESTTESH
jgi:hypothetical protein